MAKEPAASGSKPTHIERQINFHRIAAKDVKKKDRADLSAVGDRLKEKLKEGSDESDVAGDLAAWLVRATSPVRLKVARLRRSELPGQFHEGRESDLTLPEEDALSEATHFVIFPGNIVAHDRHRGGATVPDLLAYLRARIPELPALRAEVLVKRDVLDQLKEIGRVTFFKMRLHIDQVDQLKGPAPTLAKELKRIMVETSMPEIEIGLYDSQGARTSLIPTITKGFGQMLEVLGKRKSDKLQIAGYPGENFEEDAGKIDLDLLNERLTYGCKVRTTTARSRRVVAEPIFVQIEQAYNDLKDEIGRAVGASISS